MSFFEVTTYIYGGIVFGGGYLQLKFLNVAMAVYDQAEIGAINEASLILLNLLSGIVILSEYQFYSYGELAILFICGMVCITGIYIIVTKPNIKFPALKKS